MTNVVDIPHSRIRAGLACADIAPPVGIYHRMWGASLHDRSTGVHRPLTATVLALAPLEADAPASPWFAVGVDHCLLWTREMSELLESVSRQAEVPCERLTVFFSHTHAAGLMGLERTSLPGGELIPAYLQSLAERIAGAVREARERLEPAVIAYATGRCDLAAHRDYFDVENNQFVCGFDPDGRSDDTLLVGRITSRDGDVLGTIVNYACHPTTLAWDNTLISPDYVGAMREVVEQQTNAPCLFIQGASGDLGPREGFVGDVELADRHGRRLGYAVLSALEGLPVAGLRYQYAGPVVSGATIGTWRYVELPENRIRETTMWAEHACRADLPYRDDLPDREQLERDEAHWSAEEDEAKTAGDAERLRHARAMKERATRRLLRVAGLPAGESFPYAATILRMGDAVWIPLNGEHYNILARRLRERFPGRPLIVGTLANGSDVWYLPDKDSYGKGLYQERASVLACGSLERLTEALGDAVARLYGSAGGDMSGVGKTVPAGS